MHAGDWGTAILEFVLPNCQRPHERQYHGTIEIIQNFLLCQKLNFKLLDNGNYAFRTQGRNELKQDIVINILFFIIKLKIYILVYIN